MIVSIGSDHRGIEQRKVIVAAIESIKMTADDCGTDSTESADYPDFAEIVSRKVANSESDRGILICGTGIGMSIAANKIKGIRAAVCHDKNTTELSRQHNNANVLCLPGSLSDAEMAEIVQIWLNTEFEGGRHARRVDKIMALECANNPKGV